MVLVPQFKTMVLIHSMAVLQRLYVFLYVHTFLPILILKVCSFALHFFFICGALEHVRIVNGSHRCTGRVEVFMEGQWKRVCSSDWGKEAAKVLCNELSCGSPVIQSAAQYFGEGQGMSGLKTSCIGNETSISECQLQDFKESCVDATIDCMSKSCHKMSSIICCHFKIIR